MLTETCEAAKYNLMLLMLCMTIADTYIYIHLVKFYLKNMVET